MLGIFYYWENTDRRFYLEIRNFHLMIFSRKICLRSFESLFFIEKKCLGPHFSTPFELDLLLIRIQHPPIHPFIHHNRYENEHDDPTYEATHLYPDP